MDLIAIIGQYLAGSLSLTEALSRLSSKDAGKFLDVVYNKRLMGGAGNRKSFNKFKMDLVKEDEDVLEPHAKVKDFIPQIPKKVVNNSALSHYIKNPTQPIKKGIKQPGDRSYEPIPESKKPKISEWDVGNTVNSVQHNIKDAWKDIPEYMARAKGDKEYPEFVKEYKDLPMGNASKLSHLYNPDKFLTHGKEGVLDKLDQNFNTKLAEITNSGIKGNKLDTGIDKLRYNYHKLKNDFIDNKDVNRLVDKYSELFKRDPRQIKESGYYLTDPMTRMPILSNPYNIDSEIRLDNTEIPQTNRNISSKLYEASKDTINQGILPAYKEWVSSPKDAKEAEKFDKVVDQAYWKPVTNPIKSPSSKLTSAIGDSIYHTKPSAYMKSLGQYAKDYLRYNYAKDHSGNPEDFTSFWHSNMSKVAPEKYMQFKKLQSYLQQNGISKPESVIWDNVSKEDPFSGMGLKHPGQHKLVRDSYGKKHLLPYVAEIPDSDNKYGIKDAYYSTGFGRLDKKYGISDTASSVLDTVSKFSPTNMPFTIASHIPVKKMYSWAVGEGWPDDKVTATPKHPDPVVAKDEVDYNARITGVNSPHVQRTLSNIMDIADKSEKRVNPQFEKESGLSISKDVANKMRPKVSVNDNKPNTHVNKTKKYNDFSNVPDLIGKSIRLPRGADWYMTGYSLLDNRSAVDKFYAKNGRMVVLPMPGVSIQEEIKKSFLEGARKRFNWFDDD